MQQKNFRSSTTEVQQQKFNNRSSTTEVQQQKFNNRSSTHLRVKRRNGTARVSQLGLYVDETWNKTREEYRPWSWLGGGERGGGEDKTCGLCVYVESDVRVQVRVGDYLGLGLVEKRR